MDLCSLKICASNFSFEEILWQLPGDFHSRGARQRRDRNLSIQIGEGESDNGERNGVPSLWQIGIVGMVESSFGCPDPNHCALEGSSQNFIPVYKKQWTVDPPSRA